MREKLDEYLERLNNGTAREVKPKHVRKVIGKLEAREQDLLQELEETEKPSKRERLEQKLDNTRELITKARWLQDKLG